MLCRYNKMSPSPDLLAWDAADAILRVGSGTSPTELSDALRVEEGRNALLAATHIAASGARPDAALATLLDAPLPGFFHEDVLDIADILQAGPPRHMAAIRRDRLRALMDIALTGGEIGDVRVGEDGISVSGLPLAPGLAARFSQTWGRRVLG